jgi:hypothetical protein
MLNYKVIGFAGFLSNQQQTEMINAGLKIGDIIPAQQIVSNGMVHLTSMGDAIVIYSWNLQIVDNPERMIINMPEFTETIAPDVRNFALEQFHSAKIENDMIVSNYDEDGYCTFEHIGNNKFEFIGTAK